MKSSTPRILPVLAVVATFFYLILAAWYARAFLFQINPDGVAYIQIARHWAAGRADLAVNSYWGPLLSWLLVPSVWLGIDPALAVKALLITLGVGLALASASLSRRVAGEASGVAVYVAVLLFALSMSMWGITPDLPLAFFVTWYLALSAGLIRKPTRGRALSAGIVAGFAYLTKAYALPFFFAHIFVTFGFQVFAARRAGVRAGAVAPLAWAVGGFLLVALPWIATISVHDGRPTFGSASRFIRSWDSEMERQERGLPIYRLQRPRAGRITSWENPLELEGRWPTWSPFDSVSAAVRQAKMLVRGVRKTVLYTRGLDSFALVLTGVFLAAWLLAASIRRLPGDSARLLELWLFLSAGVYVGGYLLAFVRERYLWPIDGALIVLAVGAFARTAATDNGGGRGRSLFPAFSLLLILSLFLGIVDVGEEMQDPADRQMELKWLRTESARIAVEGEVVSNRWSPGLYVAFWHNAPYLGAVTGEDAAAVSRELGTFAGARTVLVFGAAELAASLDSDNRFTRIFEAVYEPTGWRVRAYTFQRAAQINP